MGEKYTPRLESESEEITQTLAIGRAGAAIVELLRKQSENPDLPYRHGADDTMFDDLIKEAGTRINPENHHDNREVQEDAVFEVAQKLDFVKPQIYEAKNELEKTLNMYSDPETYDEDVEEILIPAAAGLSNLVRLRHAINAIESGAVKTNRIIIATGQRQTTEAERSKLEKAGFTPGASEFELGKNAVKDLLGAEVEDVDGIPMNYDDREYVANLAQTTVEIGSHEVKIEILEAPYDPERVLENGKPATRANTEETFVPLKNLVDENNHKPIYVVSHDIWQPIQEMITRRMLAGKTVIGSGSQNLNRVYLDTESSQLRLNGAGTVQDELKKYLQELKKIY